MMLLRCFSKAIPISFGFSVLVQTALPLNGVLAQTKNAPAPGTPAAGQIVTQPQGESVADMVARIRILERRLNELESKKGSKANTQKTATENTPPALETSSSITPTSSVADPAEAQTKATSRTAKGQAAPTNSSAAKDEKTLQSLQTSFVFRDNAPTLEKNSFEIAVDANYTRNAGQTQFDRLMQGNLSARYGLPGGYEIAAIVPYYNAGRQTQIVVNNTTINESIQSIGDIQLQGSKQLWQQGVGYPGAALMLGATLPTGSHPFNDFGFTSTGAVADPRSPFGPLMASRGLWAAMGSLQFYKTYDPIILFFGVGFDHAFERSFSGNAVQAGDKLTYNAGFSFALSEYTTLAAQYLGSIEGPLKVNDTTVAGGELGESARGRFVLVQRLDENLYIEPSLVLGLTRDVPSYTVGVALRKRM
jgi:hypothetical protein